MTLIVTQWLLAVGLFLSMVCCVILYTRGNQQDTRIQRLEMDKDGSGFIEK